MWMIDKKSGKPFKDGRKIAIATDIVDHPYRPYHKGFLLEDGTVCSVELCHVIKEIERDE